MEIIAQLRQILPQGLVGVFLEASCGKPLRVSVDPLPQSAPDQSFRLELRIAVWLAGLEKPSIRPVPEYLRPWIPHPKAALLPIYTPVWTAGVLILDPAVQGKSLIQTLKSFATDLALQLEEADCKARLEKLQRTSRLSSLPRAANDR